MSHDETRSPAVTRASESLPVTSDARPKRPNRLGLPDLHGRHGLVAAILIDSIGTGLFLPFAVIYATLVAHISLGVTGLLLSLATVAALPVAPIVGILADRLGAQRFVVAGKVLQGVGFAGYPLMTHSWHLFLCALSVAAGNQMFWATNGAFLAQMVVVGWIERYRRTRALAFAAGLFGCYFLVLAGLAYLSPVVPAQASQHWMFAGLVAAMGVYTLAELVMAPLKNALVADAAPDALRGRYVAFYHLSWSVASATAPALLTSLLAAGPLWLWLTLVAVSCVAVLSLRALDTRLPERATRARRTAR